MQNTTDPDVHPPGFLRGLISRLDPSSVSFLHDVLAERVHQDQKWGREAHTAQKWTIIIMKWLGKFADAVLVGETEGLHRRLVQMAALAAAVDELGIVPEKTDPAVIARHAFLDEEEEVSRPEAMAAALRIEKHPDGV